MYGLTEKTFGYLLNNKCENEDQLKKSLVVMPYREREQEML